MTMTVPGRCSGYPCTRIGHRCTLTEGHAIYPGGPATPCRCACLPEPPVIDPVIGATVEATVGGNHTTGTIVYLAGTVLGVNWTGTGRVDEVSADQVRVITHPPTVRLPDRPYTRTNPAADRSRP